MPTTLTIRDETTTGDSFDAITLEFLTDRTTVRELIRARVFQEVKDYNADRGDIFRGLVQPTGTEMSLNGYTMKKRRMIEWEPQFDRACAAFEANEILVLIGDHQAETLEEEVVIAPDTMISFLKLVPLVGG